MIFLPTVRLGWRKWVALSGVVVCLGVVTATHIYVGAWGEGQRVSWIYTLYRAEMFWLTWAALLPFAISFATRYRLNLSGLSSPLVHFAAAVAFACLHIFLFSLTFPFSPSQFTPDISFRPRLFRSVRLNFGLDFLTYWAVVGATYAFHYHREVRQRELLAAQLQASLAQARLQALQAQLNPHFFFNTLNAISVLALKRDHNTVVEMLGRLGDLVRISFDNKRPQEIPLAEEMEFLDGYLEIQRLSLGDRLKIHRNIAPDTVNALVPCMILQPLVENAIVHGISAHPGPASIAIETSHEGGVLHLRVSDTGRGFGRSATHGDGIGLTNIRERLQQLYGPVHQLEYGYSTEGGAAVTISIPFALSSSSARQERSA